MNAGSLPSCLAALYSVGHNYPKSFHTNTQLRKRVGAILSVLIAKTFHGLQISTEAIQKSIGFSHTKAHELNSMGKRSSSLLYTCFRNLLAKHDRIYTVAFHRVLNCIIQCVYTVVELIDLCKNDSALLNTFEKSLPRSSDLKRYTLDDVHIISKHGNYETFDQFICDLAISIPHMERLTVPYILQFASYLQLFYAYYDIDTKYDYMEIFEGKFGCGDEYSGEYVPYLYPVFTTHSDVNNMVIDVYLIPFLVVTYESMGGMLSRIFRNNQSNQVVLKDFVVKKMTRK